MARFRAPKFGPFTEGRHAKPAGRRPLEMPEDDDAGYAGAHRREGRHSISPTTERQHRPIPTGAPAGRHRQGNMPRTGTGYETPEAGKIWYPTKTDWRRLHAGETVNGYRLIPAA